MAARLPVMPVVALMWPWSGGPIRGMEIFAGRDVLRLGDSSSFFFIQTVEKLRKGTEPQSLRRKKITGIGLHLYLCLYVYMYVYTYVFFLNSALRYA